MGKTIKEMAEDKYSVYEDAWMHKAYIEGANAVLDEIEFLYNKSRDYQLYHLLGLKLKELKGGK